MTAHKLTSEGIGNRKTRISKRVLIVLALSIVSLVFLFLLALNHMDASKRNYDFQKSMPVAMSKEIIPLRADKEVEVRGVIPRMDTPEQPAFKWPSFTWPSFCNGDETACITTVSKKPSETLRKMASAIPPGMAKQYKVSISITPIED